MDAVTLLARIVDVDNPWLNVWDEPGAPDWRWVGCGGLVLECLEPTCSMYGQWWPVRSRDGVIEVRRVGGAPFPLRREAYGV